MPLTLKQANTICEKALEHARVKNYAKLTVVVLDDAFQHRRAARTADLGGDAGFARSRTLDD